MSSILNALRKLEAEKAVQQTESASEEFQAEAAQADLLGKGPGDRGLHISPAMLIGGGAVFTLVVVAVSAAVAVMATRSRVPAGPLAAAAAPMAKALPAPKDEAPLAFSAASEAPATETATAEEPAAPKAAAVPKPNAAPARPVVPPAAEAPAPVGEVPAPAEEPEAMVLALADPLPAEPGAFPEPEAKPGLPEEPLFETPAESRLEAAAPAAPWQPPAEAVDVDALPTLRSSERTRFGLDGLRLNMLREANKNRPNGLAIINLNRIYIGEMIPGTQARLIAVERHAIGIEMMNTGGRFRIEH